MKQSSKNWLWVLISVASLIIFLFATLVVGFKFENRIPNETDLSRLISQNFHNDNYTDTTIGLLISGLVLSSLAVLFVLVKSVMDIFNWKGFIANEFWDYIFLSLIIGAGILLIVGSGFYYGMALNVPGTIAKIDLGNASLLFMLLILPIIFAILPLSIDRIKKGHSSKRTKKKIKRK